MEHDAQVLVLVVSDKHTIVAHYVVDSESEEQLKPAFYALRDRLERLGTLNDLEFWVTDRCCEGGNPLGHWITEVFPAIKRAPTKDRFHFIKGVTETLNGGFPTEKSNIGVQLYDALVEFPQEEMAPVVDYLIRSRKATSKIQARVIAKKKYRKHLRFITKPPLIQHQLWKGARDEWTAVAKEVWRERGKRCVIRKESEYTTGTLEVWEAAESHILKGCVQQPFPNYKDNFIFVGVRCSCHTPWCRAARTVICVQRMPKSGLPVYIGIDHSVKNETKHSDLNKLVNNVSRIDKKLMKPCLDFKIHFMNEQNDAVHGLRDSHSLCLFPSAEKALNERARELLTGGPLFPKAALSPLSVLQPVPKGHPYREEFGFDYFDSQESKKAKAAAAIAAAAAPADARAGTTPLDACAHSDADDASDADGDGHSTSDSKDAEGDPEDVDDDDVSDDACVAQRKRQPKQPGTGPRERRSGTMPCVAQGGSRSGKKKTRCTKSAGTNFFELSPVTPHSRAELAIVLQIIQDVQGRKTKLTLKAYKDTAQRYNAAVFQLYAQASSTAVAEVRYAPTTASLLQKYFQQERGAASRMRQESALAHAAPAEDDATATCTVRQSIRNVLEASDAAADAADTLAAMPASAPPPSRKRSKRTDGQASTKHSRFEENARRQTIEVRLTDIQSESERTPPVRTLRRLASKLGMGGCNKKKAVDLVADVRRAWERDYPNTEVLTLDPEIQPKPGTEEQLRARE